MNKGCGTMDRGVPRIGRSGCDRMDEFAPELVRGVIVRPHDVSVSVEAGSVLVTATVRYDSIAEARTGAERWADLMGASQCGGKTYGDSRQ